MTRLYGIPSNPDRELTPAQRSLLPRCIALLREQLSYADRSDIAQNVRKLCELSEILLRESEDLLERVERYALYLRNNDVCAHGAMAGCCSTCSALGKFLEPQ